ncbi:PDDEXK family nuclease [Acinetobacter schindleri]
MAQFGSKVLRFDNGQVMGRIDDVANVIYKYCLNELSKESP